MRQHLKKQLVVQHLVVRQKLYKKAAKKVLAFFAKASETPAQKLISVGDRVLFGYDSAELSAEAKLTLDQQSRFLRANADLTFTIEGHCDERGTKRIQLALGEQRATAVRDYLVIEEFLGQIKSNIIWERKTSSHRFK